MKTAPREPSNVDLRIVRWTIGFVIVALVALLLWFEWGWQRDDADRVAETAPAAGGDMVPPVDEDAAAPPKGGDSGHAPSDVIPPEEP